VHWIEVPASAGRDQRSDARSRELDYETPSRVQHREDLTVQFERPGPDPLATKGNARVTNESTHDRSETRVQLRTLHPSGRHRVVGFLGEGARSAPTNKTSRFVSFIRLLGGASRAHVSW
jgi:hypothetical protein